MTSHLDELERALDGMNLSPSIRRQCELSERGSVELTVPFAQAPLGLDELLDAVAAGVGLRVELDDDETFDLSVFAPVIGQLRSLNVDADAAQVVGWEVLQGCRDLEELSLHRSDIPVELPFEQLEHLWYANLSGPLAHQVGAAPNLRVLGLNLGPSGPPSVRASLIDLMVAGKQLADIAFLEDPSRLEFLRVVGADQFDLASTSAASSLARIEMVMCGQLHGLSALAQRALDTLDLSNVGSIDDASALELVDARVVRIEPNRSIDEPLLARLRSRDGWWISPYLPPRVTARSKKVNQPNDSKQADWTAFEVIAPSELIGRWELVLRDRNLLSVASPEVAGLTFPELEDAARVAIGDSIVKPDAHIQFDSESGQFVVSATSRAAISEVAKILSTAWWPERRVSRE